MILLTGREMMQSASVNFIHSFPNISGVPMMTSTVRGAGNSNEQQLQQAESSLWHKNSVVVGSVVTPHGFSCPKACGILVPQPGIEPMSPALQGESLTTAPPGKS